MTDQIHLTEQYLATAGISFLDKKVDDSYTNLGFITTNGYLETWPFKKYGCKIVLNYTRFSLYWIINDTTRMTLYLDGKSHSEILENKNIGSNAFLTDKIENYPGFTNNLGPDLMHRMSRGTHCTGCCGKGRRGSCKL